MDLFKKTDQALIAWTEKKCHTFQRITGKTHFSLLLYLSGVLGISNLGITVLWREELPPFLVLLGALLSLGMFTVGLRMPQKEKEAQERVEGGLANPDKIDPKMIFGRMLSLFMAIAYSGRTALVYQTEGWVLFSVILWLWWVFDILSACDPLPPCKGKIGEFLASLFLKRAPINTK